MVEKHRRKLQEVKKAKLMLESGVSESAANLIANEDQLDLAHVNFLLEMLQRKKSQLQVVSLVHSFKTSITRL